MDPSVETYMSQHLVARTSFDDVDWSPLSEPNRTVMYGGDPYEDDVERVAPAQSADGLSATPESSFHHAGS